MCRLFVALLLGLLGLLSWAARPAAAVELNHLFSDGAVIQRDQPIPVWGTGEPGEALVVNFADQQLPCNVDKDGNWKVVFKPVHETGGPLELTVSGTNRIIVHDILMGEVWLCSGQSNMQLSVSFSDHDKEDIEKAKNPNLRIFIEHENISGKPVSVVEGTWTDADPSTVADFSAVPYYFGRAMQKELGVPVGVIVAAMGGAHIKSWLSEEALESINEGVPQDATVDLEPLRKLFDKRIEQWRKDVADARTKGLPEPPQPSLAVELLTPAIRGLLTSSASFNAMINPLIPYAIKGICWYQGESDVGLGKRYGRIFTKMIDDWRARWQLPGLPFIIVQLPACMSRGTKQESYWAELREQQALARRIPYTFVSVAIDTAKGDEISLHPREKKEIGERLALIALATQYKKSKPFYGPLYDSMEVQGSRAKLNFRYAEGGLVSKDKDLKGFTIAGPDKKFVPASARIYGSSVIVWNEKVAAPAAVRYAWADNPIADLYNKYDLPAAPFRTDSWPIPRPKASKASALPP